MAGHFRSLTAALAGAALVLTACTAAPSTPPPQPGGSTSAIEPTTLNFFTDHT